MTIALIDRIIALLEYIDANNTEPSGPSRSRDIHLIVECGELKNAMENEKRLLKREHRSSAEAQSHLIVDGLVSSLVRGTYE